MLGENHFGARYGGDEFVVILRDADKQEPLPSAAGCRKRSTAMFFLSQKDSPFTLRQASHSHIPR